MEAAGVEAGHDDRGEIEGRREKIVALVPPLHAAAGVEPFGDQADIVLQERYGQEGRGQDDAEKEPALPIIEAS